MFSQLSVCHTLAVERLKPPYLGTARAVSDRLVSRARSPSVVLRGDPRAGLGS
jgi:hypothetical protein